jgi:MoxR-like ATPase
VSAPTADSARASLEALRTEIAKAVVGQDPAVTGLVVALLCRGHVLLEGVPGVAKTLLVRALAASLQLETKRIQFTPDLMPGDITGSLVYDARTAEFSFQPGPVFTNLLLADEINRTPPKTQASLLEAMEERQVSVDGTPRPLPDPFLVAATQNPVEYEGTYPLPEAQVDRFMVRLSLGYPDAAGEAAMLATHESGDRVASLEAVADAAELLAAQDACARVRASEPLRQYIVALLAHTRADPLVELGASPRAGLLLLRAAKARALLAGRDHALPDDVQEMVAPVLAHRIVLAPDAFEATGEQVVAAAVAATPAL